MPAARIKYPNLRCEMARRKIKIVDIATVLGVTRGTLGLKLAQKYPITLDESFVLRDTFFPNLSLDYLFQKE